MKAAAAFVASVLTAFSSGAATTTPATLMPCANISKTLQLGSRSPEVAKLQQVLSVSKTGYFGPVTKASLVKWQVSKGIIKSGKTAGAGTTGPRTRAALACAPVSAKAVATPPPVPQNSPPAPPPASSTTSSPIPPPTSSPTPAASGGSSSPGGVSGAEGCSPFAKQKSTAACSVGEWEKIIDESGCYIDWECIDPNQQG